MRRFRVSMIPLLMLSPLFAEETSPLYDLETCARAAMAQNPALALARGDVETAEARLLNARVALFPAVSAKADQTRGRADVTLRQPAFLQRSYGVQATQSVFNGGRLWAAHGQASLGAEIARLQFDKQKLQVRHAVTEAYWRAVAWEKAASIYRQTSAELQDNLEKAVRHELSARRGARIELLSSRAHGRACEAALSEAEEARWEARTALLDAMGERRAASFRLPEELPTGRAIVDEAEVLRLFRAHRPEVKIQEKLMESARMARRVSRSAYFPKVDVNGFLGRSGAAFIESDPFVYKKDWNAGVSVSWPIVGNSLKYSGFRDHTSPRLGESSRTETESQSVSFSLGDGLSARADALEARKAFAEEQWRADRALRDMEGEARLAARKLETAWRRLALANARAEESAQQLRETRALLQDDRAHLGDLAGARQRLAEAQAGQAQAQAQYLIALSALNLAVDAPDYFAISRKETP